MATQPQQRGETTDPTALTTDALRRENANLKELLQVHISGLVAAVDRHEEAISVSIPAVIAAQATHDERFNGIKDKFADLSDRTKELKLDGKSALDAALQAA